MGQPLRRSIRQRTSRRKQNDERMQGEDQYELRHDIEHYTQKEDLSKRSRGAIEQPFQVT